MKTDLLLLSILCLLLGCTASRREVDGNTQSSRSHPPVEYVAPQLQPAPRGEAPPFILMSGEFKKMGRYAWTNGMTLQDGIDAAGGFTDFARRRLNLQHWDGSREFYRLGPGRTLTNNPALRRGDRVYSPWFDL